MDCPHFTDERIEAQGTTNSLPRNTELPGTEPRLRVWLLSISAGEQRGGDQSRGQCLVTSPTRSVAPGGCRPTQPSERGSPFLRPKEGLGFFRRQPDWGGLLAAHFSVTHFVTSCVGSASICT